MARGARREAAARAAAARARRVPAGHPAGPRRPESPGGAARRQSAVDGRRCVGGVEARRRAVRRCPGRAARGRQPRRRAGRAHHPQRGAVPPGPGRGDQLSTRTRPPVRIPVRSTRSTVRRRPRSSGPPTAGCSVCRDDAERIAVGLAPRRRLPPAHGVHRPGRHVTGPAAHGAARPAVAAATRKGRSTRARRTCRSRRIRVRQYDGCDWALNRSIRTFCAGATSGSLSWNTSSPRVMSLA